MKKYFFLFITLCLVLIWCWAETQNTIKNPNTQKPNTENIVTENTHTVVQEWQEIFSLDAWADNWFALYNWDELIIEDSISITTERSFNSESTQFAWSYPLHLNVILKDYKENDTGLEYIGSKRQQMGDGWFIMQIADSTGKHIAVTNDSWKCMVIHNAPLDKACESSSNPEVGVWICASESTNEPENWKSNEFDDSSWPTATVHTASSVDPKMWYDDISWDSTAEFIWWPDLETNNTVLCRITIEKDTR